MSAIAMVAVAACASTASHSVQSDHERLLRARFELAEAPRDPAVHARVGRLELAAGNRGEALERLAAAVLNGAGSQRDRVLLGELLGERVAARVADADPGARIDIERFERLAPEAFARWKASAAGSDAMRQAAQLARVAQLRVPGTVDLVDDATPEQLAAEAAVAREHGARHAALALLTEYLRRGGRSVEALDVWAELVAWRRGDDLGPLWTELSRAREAGAFMCGVARTPLELGCSGQLEVAAHDPRRSAVVWRRARARFWHTADPEQAGAWVALALQAWARGDALSWEAAVRERIDVAAMAGGDPAAPGVAKARATGSGGLGGVELAARATLLRLADRRDAARKALAEVLATAGLGPVELAPGYRALVVAEAAAQGMVARDLEALAERLAVPAYGWLAPLAAARAAGDRDAVARLARRAGVEALAPLALERLQAAPSRPLLSAAGVVPAPAEPPLDAGAPSGQGDSAWRRIERAYAQDPALADRRAREWVALEPWAAEQKRALVNGFLGLGDAARARRWAESLVDDSPNDPRALFLAAVAAAAERDLDAADVLLVEAAALSGNPGQWLLAGARVFARVGGPLAAVGAARRAIEQTPSGRRGPILALLVRSQVALGREEQAERARQQWLADVREPFRSRAKHGRRGPPVAAGEPSEQWAAERQASSAARSLEQLDRAIAWQPLNVALRRARLARTDPGEPRFVDVARDLWALGFARTDAIGQKALAAAAEAAESLGQASAASVARRELERRRRNPLLPDPFSDRASALVSGARMSERGQLQGAKPQRTSGL